MSRRTLKLLPLYVAEFAAIFAFTYGTTRYVAHHGEASALAQCSR